MHRRADMKYLVYGILFVLISFLVILGVLHNVAKKADVEQGLKICRASLALQENSQIGTDVLDLDLTYKLAPLLCKTYDLDIPEKSYGYEDSHEDAIRNIADRIADCWWEFGEGVVEKDVFEKNLFFGGKKCFSCFTFTLNELKDGNTVEMQEVYDYMSNNPYKAIAEDKPFCTDGNKFEDPDSGEITTDCVSKDLPECERKGGSCESYCAASRSLSSYEDWSCPKGKECCIDNANLVSYMEYLYLYKGEGMLSTGDDLDKFTKDETYTIAFISQTTDFGWTIAELGTFFLPQTKILSAVARLGNFAKLAKISNVAMKIEKFGGRTGRALVKTPATAAVGGLEVGVEEINELFSGSPQIIMIAPTNDIDDICTVQEEVGQ